MKENIILCCDFQDAGGIALLEEIANGNDDLLAFQAIKKLNQTDRETAVVKAKAILENYTTQTPEKVSAALKVMAKEFRQARVSRMMTDDKTKEKLEFIGICSDIIDSAASPKDKLKDSAIFALSEMTDRDAMIEIIQNPGIDTSLKTYAIDQNALTLQNMLTEKTTSTDIEAVCKAMEIYPIKELAEPLAAAKTSITSKQSRSFVGNDEAAIVEKMEASIIKVQEEGNTISPKAVEYYNGSDKMG